MYLVFDTETTGIAADSHIVQIAMVQLDSSFQEIQTYSEVIRPDGYEIPQQAVAIHGITTEYALRVGVPIEHALDAFDVMCANTSVLVAHNIDFDLRMIQSTLTRLNRNDATNNMSKYCTMKSSRDCVRLPPTERMVQAGRNHYKSPKLEEAYEHFNGESFDNAHDALADVWATVSVLINLKRFAS